MGRIAAAGRETLRRLRRIGPVRLVLTLLFLAVALLCARWSWQLPLARDAERALYDVRFSWAADRVAQDDRITLVTYNDQTLQSLGKRSPLDRKLLADALKAIDAMRPKAIGIDILIDQAQPEDPYLLDVLRRMRTPVYLGFTSAEANPDQMEYWQEQFLRAFLGRAAAGPVRPASIKLLTDPADDVMRRWPVAGPGQPPLLAAAMAPKTPEALHPEFGDYGGALAYRLPARADMPVFTNLPIDAVTAFPEGVRTHIAGRYVLIGGDIRDLDNFGTPMSRGTSGGWMKGLEVHAHLLAQLLDGRMPRPLPGLALWALALAAIVAGGLTSLAEAKRWKLAVLLALQLAGFGALPFLLQKMKVDTLDLPAFGWGVGWVLAFAAVGAAAKAVGSEQRKFAQSALGKYLPPDVAALILKEPERLSLRGERKCIFALFTDLEGFTKLSHAIGPERLSELLNAYLDTMSETALRHGGTIDKFVGDAVVAFWGAPIARDDDGDRAIDAAVAMYQAGEKFRASAGADIPPVGCTRVGLHRGDAVVGNFGGRGRIQYTALGDGMNTASRLESANKLLKSTILVSDEAKSASTRDIFRPLGRVVLSGRSTPVVLWEPVPDMPAEERTLLTRLWHAHDGGDPAALAALEEIADARKEDAALADFVYRIGKAGPGGHFVLASK